MKWSSMGDIHSRRGERKHGAEKPEEMVAEDFPNGRQGTDVREALWTPGMVNSETHTETHYKQTFERQTWKLQERGGLSVLGISQLEYQQISYQTLRGQKAVGAEETETEGTKRKRNTQQNHSAKVREKSQQSQVQKG